MATKAVADRGSKSAGTTPERVPMGTVIDTNISARLDRLPWGRFHVLVIVALCALGIALTLL